MGAWGYGPFDSDNAHDWVDGLEQLAIDHIRAALKPRKRGDSEAYAAAGLLADLTRRESLLNLSWKALESGLFESAEEALKRILMDDRGVAEWNDPAKYRHEVGKLRRLLARRRRQEQRAQEEARKRIVIKQGKAS
jgi:Domain of unknown function (DUF4259)